DLDVEADVMQGLEREAPPLAPGEHGQGRAQPEVFAQAVGLGDVLGADGGHHTWSDIAGSIRPKICQAAPARTKVATIDTTSGSVSTGAPTNTQRHVSMSPVSGFSDTNVPRVPLSAELG